MSLPDISHLLAGTGAAGENDRWPALAARLRTIGLTGEYVAPLLAIGTGFSSTLRAPVRMWHARRLQEPAGYAARLFLFQDRLTREEGKSVFGEGVGDGAFTRGLLDAGLVVKDADGSVRCPFQLQVTGPIFILCDVLKHGTDAVMGAAETTAALAVAGRPSHRAKRALDVGCGAGTVALLYAAECDLVVATDISSRALAFARVNARMNGVANVEFREGDLFAPVAGETFDLIVSQPPFMPRVEGAAPTLYRDGGERGDELPLRLMRELPAFLAPGGRAVVLVEWPVENADEKALEARVRAAIANDELDVLLVQSPNASLDEFSIMYAATEHPELGEAYERAAIGWRGHFEKMNIKELKLTLNVISRPRTTGETGTAPHRGWTSTVVTRRFSDERATSERIQKMVEARDLLARGDAAVLSASLCITPGTSFTQQNAAGSAPTNEPLVLVQLPRDALIEPIAVNVQTYKLLQMIDRAPSVRHATQELSVAIKQSFEETAKKVLPAVSMGLRYGLLRSVAP